MKKFISILVSFMVLQTTVFASAADGLMTALEKSQTLKSASAHMVFETELNKPLDIIEQIPESADEYADINPRMIVESLIESKMIADCDYSVSEDYKKLSMAMSMEFDVPVSFNEDFKLNAWTKLGMWMDYDVTDAENPVYKMVFKIPFMKKYMVLDMSEYYKNNPDKLQYFDAEDIKGISQKAFDMLKNNASISKTGSGYSVKFTDEGFKAYYIECLNLAKDFIPSDKATYEDFDKIIADIQYFCDNVTVLGKDGFTMNISVNPSGFISFEAVDVHICMNIYDILTVYSKNTNGLEREKAFVDMTAKLSADISKHNKTEVTMPVLTEENSEIEIFSDYPTYSPYYNKSEESPVLKNDNIYYPIETIAEQCAMAVEKNDSSITITDGDNIVTIASNAINGEAYETEVPLLINENGKFYCTEDALYPLCIYIGSISYDIDEKTLKFWFSYEQYDEETTEEVIAEEVYIPDYLEYDFYLDRLPFEKNGVVYMPVYEFVQTLYEGRFEFGTNSVTYFGETENVFGIKSITAKAGDGFVTVNGENRSLDAPVEIKDGVIYIPVTFAYSLGLEGGVDAYYTQGDGSSAWYSFGMPNPEYDSGEWDYEDYDSGYYYVHSDQLPHMSNETIYIPIYDLLLELYDGEFSFTENGLTYTAVGENAFNIEAFSVFDGDKFVTVNGEKLELASEVVMINGILRVPIGLVTDMGLTVDDIYISTYDKGTTYWLSRNDNSNHYDDYSNDLNWFEALF